MKNILVFGLTETKGGVESVIMNYYNNVNPKKVHFDFLCNTKVVAYEDHLKKSGSKIFRIPPRNKNPLTYHRALKSFFEKHANSYDAIWINVCSLANIDYLIYAKKFNIKTRIIHSHNSENMDSKLRGILHKINRLRINHYATNFWSCSQKATDWFYTKKIQSTHTVKIINNAIDIDKYKFDKSSRQIFRRQNSLEKNLVITNVGRLHFQKNQTFVLEIFSEILKSEPSARLVLIGQGPDESALKLQAKNLNILDKTHFLGQVDNIPAALSGSDIFLFPSVFEGLGLACIEAEVNGLFVFASRKCMPKEVKISPYFHFIGLDKSPRYWSKKILQSRQTTVDRNNPKIYDRATAHNFNIQSEAKKLEDFFSNLKNNQKGL